MACCLMHQAITWTNFDLSLIRLSDIHLRASSQETTQPSITEIILKNYVPKNELKQAQYYTILHTSQQYQNHNIC